MSKIIKKYSSILLLIAFMFTFCFSSFTSKASSIMTDSSLTNQQLIESISDVSNDLYTKYPELKNINNKTIKLLQSGINSKDVINRISKEDLKKLRNIYKEIDLSSATSNSFEDNINIFLEGKGYNAKEYIQQIENKANQYYLYYKLHNEFPKNDDKDSLKGFTTSLAATYDPALAAMGYNITAAVLAEQLASLTAICGTAFHILHLLHY